MLWEKLSGAAPEGVLRSLWAFLEPSWQTAPSDPSPWGPIESRVFFQMEGTDQSSGKEALHPQKAGPSPLEMTGGQRQGFIVKIKKRDS